MLNMPRFRSEPIVILSAARTPIGSFMGELIGLTAVELGAASIRGALAACATPKDAFDEVLMGCVLPAGLGQAPARQAALASGLPESIPCTTVNKVCGSGMKAVIALHDALAVESVSLGVAGGMESMSNTPYLLSRARSGYRIGHGALLDHMMVDGLEDAYEVGRSMGEFGEDCARQYGFSREQQDEYARDSIEWALHASHNGAFFDEIIPVDVPSRQGAMRIDSDEGPRRASLEKIATLKPAFSKNGTITAASSSSISDGAAALVMCRESTAEALGIKPLARLVGHASFAREPRHFPTAPIGAIRSLCNKNRWRIKDVDLWEINEAFAVVVLAAIQDLKISRSQVNVHGGACALGHPIGASGARIIVTLIHALRFKGARRGVASLCIGGGEATAVGIELV